MKKTITKLFILLSLSLLLFTSCVSAFEAAGSAMSDGDYVKAVEKSLEALDKDPDMEEADVLLKESWNRANKEWLDEINTYAELSKYDAITGDLSQWVISNPSETNSTIGYLEKSMPVYDKLLKVHQIVERAKRYDLNPDSEGANRIRLQSKQKLSDLYFALGNKYLAMDGRDTAREALSYYEKVKSQIPSYANIDKVYDQAFTKATVKVIIFEDPSIPVQYGYATSLSNKFNSNKLIDVISINKQFSNINSSAIQYAKSQGADLILYFNQNINAYGNFKNERTPVNSQVTAQRGWELEKSYLEVSGTANISYSIIDVQNSSILSVESYSLTDSTDFGFSVTSLIATSKVENLKIGTMNKHENLKVAILEPDASTNDLAIQLKWFDGVEFDGMYGHDPAVTTYMNFSNSNYDNAKSLSKYRDINNHLFIPYDVFKIPSSDPMYNDGYSFVYKSYIGEGNNGSIETSRMETSVYENLIRTMKSSNFAKKSASIFVDDTLTQSALNSLAKRVLPYLK